MVRLQIFRFAVLTLALLAVLTPLASAEEVNGKIVSVLEAKRDRFVIESGRQNLIFHLDRQGRVFINEKESTLANLLPNDNVAVVYEQNGMQRVASEVRCLRK